MKEYEVKPYLVIMYSCIWSEYGNMQVAASAEESLGTPQANKMESFVTISTVYPYMVIKR